MLNGIILKYTQAKACGYLWVCREDREEIRLNIGGINEG